VIGWIFIVSGTVCAVIQVLFRQKWPISVMAIFAGLIVLFSILGGSYLTKQRYLLKGKLEPVRINPQKPITVNLGSNLLTTDYSELREGIDLNRFIHIEGFEYPVKIKFLSGQILVSAFIRDEKGKMIAQIVNNDWLVNPEGRYDRNFSNNAFEVINNINKIPIFQIVLKDQNNIYIGGVFYYEKGRIVASQKGLFINPGDKRPEDNIRCIFRYPGDKHLGQLLTE